MKLNFLKHTCVALALIAPIATASAAVVTIERTIDLNALDLNALWIVSQEASPAFLLAVGDTLNLHIDFAGNQTLRVQKPLNIIAMVMATDSECVNFTSTGSIAFADAIGPLQPETHTETMGCSHLGNQFEESAISAGAGAVEFSGLSFSMHVDAYDIGSVREYRNSWFQMAGEGFAIGQLHAVPEPAGLGLMGLAALLLGRKRLRPGASA